MYLQDFDRYPKIAWFDPAEGTIDEFEDREGRDVAGYCDHTDDGWVAVYPDPDDRTVLVRIDGEIWDLRDPDTDIVYSHDQDDDTTQFAIRDDDGSFETTYDHWMMDTEVWSMDSNEDWQEDIFGYAFELWQDDEMASRFVENKSRYVGEGDDLAGS